MKTPRAADFRRGQIILPPEVEAFFKVTYYAFPETDDPNLLAACRFVLWHSGLQANHPDLPAAPSPRLKRWLMEPAEEWARNLPDAGVPFSRLLFAVAAIRPLPWGLTEAEDRLCIWWWLLEHFPDFPLPDWAERLFGQPSPRLPGYSLLLEGLRRKCPEIPSPLERPSAALLQQMHTLAPDIELPGWLNESLARAARLVAGFPVSFLLDAVWRHNAGETAQDHPSLQRLLGGYFSTWRKCLPEHSLSGEQIDALLKKNETGGCLLLECCRSVSPYAAADSQSRLAAEGWFARNIWPDLPFPLPLWLLNKWKSAAAETDVSGFSYIAKALQASSHALASLRPENEAERSRILRDLEQEQAIPASYLFSGRALLSAAARGNPAILKHSGGKPGGLNLAGWIDGVSGIGEDARNMYKALQAGKIPCALWDVTQSTPHGSPREALLKPEAAETADYFATLAQLAAQDFYRWQLTLSDRFRAGRVFFGCFPWELPRWPQEYMFMLEQVDEIWALSTFIAKAFSAAPCPVRKVPPVVHIAEELRVQASAQRAAIRAKAGVAHDDFLFLFTLDASSIIRKNPEAAIRAFQLAFPPETPNARLLVKSINARYAPGHMHRLHELRNGDERIILLDAVWSRPETISLFSACDCYVSLHRSEGFGRGMAEALLLEKPVIASAYSGNLDFTTPETSFLVGGSMVENPPNGSLPGILQEWFDPDVEEAARQMRLVYDNPGLSAEKAGNGRALIQKRHSPEAVGSLIGEILRRYGLL